VITVPELAAEALGSFLADHITRRFGSKIGGWQDQDCAHRPGRIRPVDLSRSQKADFLPPLGY